MSNDYNSDFDDNESPKSDEIISHDSSFDSDNQEQYQQPENLSNQYYGQTNNNMSEPAKMNTTASQQQTRQPMSMRTRKKAKKEQEAEDMTKFNNNAAEVAKNLKGVPIAQAAGHVHSKLNEYTGGKWGELSGKMTAQANRMLGPAGKNIQRTAKFLNKSGIGDKIGKAASIKSRFSGGAGAAGNAGKAANTVDNASKSSSLASNLANKTNKSAAGEEKKISLPSMGGLKKKENGTKNDSKNGKAIKYAKFFVKHPTLLIPLGILVALLLIVIFIAIGKTTDDDDIYGTGLGGYSYIQLDNICKTVTVYKKDDNGRIIQSVDVDFEKEYIPGVVNAEISYFANNVDMGKVFAIAARSYALSVMDERCEIEGSARRQAFTFDEATRKSIINNPDHPIMQAVNATYGLVFVKGDTLQTGYYDAACYRREDEDYYYLGYGSLTLGEEHEQAIPRDWAESQSGLMDYINAAKAHSTPCYHNHGYGISQYGAYYLATQRNYNYEQLLEYYYGDGSIKSIYESSYTMETSSGTNDILTMDLETYLNNNGTSVEALNEYILSEILKSGFGTRKAVVSVATALVSGLYQGYNARLPYTMCGQHGCADMYNADNENVNRYATSFYGADPNWGSRIHNSSDGNYHYNDGENSLVYTRYGPDCSGFVSWVLHNAGFNNQTLGADAFAELGDKYLFDGTRLGEPGDLVYSNGHIMLIVGVNDSREVYYIAHASGGTEGVKINALSYSASGYYAVDMSDWYSTHSANIDKNEFRAGYVNGYTGEDPESFRRSSFDKGIFFVGDSRTVGLCYVEKLCNDSDNCVSSSCLSKVGVGFSWLLIKGSDITPNTKGNVVINMGVNDLVGTPDPEKLAKLYFEYYTKLAEHNSSKTIYIMSVNPTTETSTVSPNNVIRFNNEIQLLIYSSNIPNIKYLDAYNNVDFDIENDGIHYTFDTYRRIYNYVIGEIK